MKAIFYESFGSAKDVLKLDDIAQPEVGANNVVVKLYTSGVNPSDVKARAGARPGVLKPQYPRIIPHSDGAGEIVDVGVKVPASRIGQRVWVWNGQWRRAFGTASEYITVNQDQAVPLPDGISFEVGATLGIPGLTACHAVLGNGDVRDQCVLVSGGAGTVGHIAVQIAKASGAKVISTVSNDVDKDSVIQAGADHVLFYNDLGLKEQIMEASAGNGIDRIVEVEFGQNIEINTEVIREGGRIVSYGSTNKIEPRLPFYPLMFKGVNLELMLVYLLPYRKRLRTIGHLSKLLEEKKLNIRIHKTFNFEDCYLAHEEVETGRRKGSVIVRID